MINVCANDNYSVAGVYTDFHKEHTNTNNANAQSPANPAITIFIVVWRKMSSV